MLRSRAILASTPPITVGGDAMRPLTVDLTQLDRRPYFLWDEDVSVAELRALLRGPPGPAA
jgi:hypothetical protein